MQRSLQLLPDSNDWPRVLDVPGSPSDTLSVTQLLMPTSIITEKIIAI